MDLNRYFARLTLLVLLFHPKLKSCILKAISQQVVCFTWPPTKGQGQPEMAMGEEVKNFLLLNLLLILFSPKITMGPKVIHLFTGAPLWFYFCPQCQCYSPSLSEENYRSKIDFFFFLQTLLSSVNLPFNLGRHVSDFSGGDAVFCFLFH